MREDRNRRIVQALIEDAAENHLLAEEGVVAGAPIPDQGRHLGSRRAAGMDPPPVFLWRPLDGETSIRGRRPRHDAIRRSLLMQPVLRRVSWSLMPLTQSSRAAGGRTAPSSDPR